MNEARPFHHFSVDDVFDALMEVADQNLPLFEHRFFAFLKSLHDEFETKVDLYVFMEGEKDGRVRRLDELPDRLRPEFESAPWLRLGPHALNYAVKPFEQSPEEQSRMITAIYKQIERFAGETARSRWLRLHYFSESYEIAPTLSAQGVDTLLLTDKPAVAYHLPESGLRELQRTGVHDLGGLRVRRSFPRMEHLVTESWSDDRIEAALRSRLDEHGYVSLFTHEIEVDKTEVRDMTRHCLALMRSLKAVSR